MTNRTRIAKPLPPTTLARSVESPGEREEETRYELVLYIAGTTPQSAATLETLIAVCSERLAGRYDLIVVDVYQEPARAKQDGIIAVPTLVKKRPLPLRRLIGDLSERSQLLSGLSLPPDREHEG